ncbi:L,D-transpeptidase family protein [Sphingomonas rhizophila]|uniref:L,D-transpeptidase family protein n=1 Tax=Sphingomonas rhizophila TaxID=2071607 RepID=A0A7G9S8X5_9SPHN|nr:L,D-transpeptidase family protein [Sphingomonas rhizophila]QNN64300.1 L,D-transpeptidase family protein [Sphingomonas rhizophila]
MTSLAKLLAVTGAFALAVTAAPAGATIETPEAKAQAAEAADIARGDVMDHLGDAMLRPGQYRWVSDARPGEPVRVVVSLSDQMAYVYGGDRLLGYSTISSGKAGKDTPTGIFPILEKKTMHRSRKYDNAPMPFMQRLDNYGIAMHAGANPGYPASHGCIRLPAKFAAKLYGVTRVGSTVMIGA